MVTVIMSQCSTRSFWPSLVTNRTTLPLLSLPSFCRMMFKINKDVVTQVNKWHISEADMVDQPIAGGNNAETWREDPQVGGETCPI